jgi:hypothetical protein
MAAVNEHDMPSGGGLDPQRNGAVGEAPESEGGGHAGEHGTPIGALAVVGFLTVVIAVFWFGMFALNMVRN